MNVVYIIGSKVIVSLRNRLLQMLMNGHVSVGGYDVEDSELGMVEEKEGSYGE